MGLEWCGEGGIGERVRRTGGERMVSGSTKKILRGSRE